MRTVRNEENGSVFDYLRWLGVEDEWGNTWKNWLGEDFRASKFLTLSMLRNNMASVRVRG